MLNFPSLLVSPPSADFFLFYTYEAFDDDFTTRFSSRNLERKRKKMLADGFFWTILYFLNVKNNEHAEKLAK